MIAYLTFDDVNPVLSAELARKIFPGMAFRTINSPQLAAEGELLVYDLDHLPPEWRANLFHQAAAGQLTGNVAAHSYNLTVAEMRVLRSAGVRIARRIAVSLFVGLPVMVSDRFVRNDCSSSGAVAV